MNPRELWLAEVRLAPTVLRIAWVGPVPTDSGGVAGVATQLIGQLAALGHHIDCFFPDAPSSLPRALQEQPTIETVWAGTRWAWGKWYSKNATGAFITSLAARAWAFRRLRREMTARHASAPYDVVYQFSNIEVVGVPRSIRRTVPLVIHPETHIAGELRWYRAEADLAKQCDPNRLRRLLVLSMLIIRVAIQRRTIGWAQAVVCISSVFRDDLIRDYGIAPERTFVLPNPVNCGAFEASTTSLHDPPVVLVLGRVSVRKGVDQIVELTHRLADAGVVVTIRIVGGHTLWSDYRPLLAGANSDNTTYVGPIRTEEVAAELAAADILVQASKYEPFGLTVGEALASGVPVVATDAVGAIEGTSHDATEVTGVGDADALVAAVQSLLERLGERPVAVRRAARHDAERLFDPGAIALRLSYFLVALSSGTEATDLKVFSSRP